MLNPLYLPIYNIFIFICEKMLFNSFFIYTTVKEPSWYYATLPQKMLKTRLSGLVLSKTH